VLILEVDDVYFKPPTRGLANQPYHQSEAVLILLDDFSLWVTASYKKGQLMLPCVREAEQSLAKVYEEENVRLEKFTRYIEVH
jgi:hypothetical protein